MVFAAIGVRDEILSIPRLHRSRLDQMLVRGRLHARQQSHADEWAQGSIPGATHRRLATLTSAAERQVRSKNDDGQ
jgi:hypothetical protein